jgi:hypothetical protein
MSETEINDTDELIRACETLIEEWRMARDDERGERKARVAYDDCAAELEHNLKRLRNGSQAGDRDE